MKEPVFTLTVTNHGSEVRPKWAADCVGKNLESFEKKELALMFKTAAEKLKAAAKSQKGKKPAKPTKAEEPGMDYRTWRAKNPSRGR